MKASAVEADVKKTDTIWRYRDDVRVSDVAAYTWPNEFSIRRPRITPICDPFPLVAGRISFFSRVVLCIGGRRAC